MAKTVAKNPHAQRLGKLGGRPKKDNRASIGEIKIGGLHNDSRGPRAKTFYGGQ